MYHEMSPSVHWINLAEFSHSEQCLLQHTWNTWKNICTFSVTYNTNYCVVASTFKQLTFKKLVIRVDTYSFQLYSMAIAW